ncbi:MAG: hypothetical protein V4857_12885 [Pseudomonadota bacterium]
MTPASNQRLLHILNTWTLRELPDWSAAPMRADPDATVAAILHAGYAGLQMEPGDPLMEAGFRAAALMHASGRVVDPARARDLVTEHKERGFSLSTIHLGTGFESQAEGYALAEAVLEASAALSYPLYVETHRATITQDPRRTLDLVERYPDLRLNGDFSHWYCGCEMRYGDWERKLALLQPVFERTRYLHGRIADSGAMQVAVADLDAQHVQDFRHLWTRAMAGFLSTAAAGDMLFFAPELLPNRFDVNGTMVYPAYARQLAGPDGRLADDSDRWSQGLLLTEIGARCFEDACASL